jgi:hypothetical protein
MNAPQTLPPGAAQSVADVVDGANAAAAAIQTRLVASPYVTLGAAVGVGFIVAGGLASPAVWGLAKLAARIGVAAATRKIGQAVLDGATRDDG